MSALTERFTENTETKPGIFSTEFYVALATIVMIVIDAIPSPERLEGPIAGAIAAIYALSRGIAKSGQQHYGPARVEPDIDYSELEPGDLEEFQAAPRDVEPEYQATDDEFVRKPEPEGPAARAVSAVSPVAKATTHERMGGPQVPPGLDPRRSR